MATEVVIGHNNIKRSSSLGRDLFPPLRSPSHTTLSILSGIEAVVHSLSVLLRFQTGKVGGVGWVFLELPIHVVVHG